MIFPKAFEKSLTTCESEINPLTVMENSFLQRFFKHLLGDVFNDSISSFEEKISSHQIIDNSSKYLAQSLFKVKENLQLGQLLRKMGFYLVEKSPSFYKGELSKCLEMKYSNVTGKDIVYGKNQILFTEVKINACFQALEQIPQKMKNLLYSLTKSSEENNPIKKLLENQRTNTINFLIVYFGNYDFRLANKEHFQTSSITLFGRKIKLQTQVIFISKVALVETFKTTIKVPNLQQINQNIIQLYQFKRTRGRDRKRRHSQRKVRNNNSQLRGGSLAKKQNNTKIEQYGLKAMIGITAVGLAVATISKIFR